MSNRADYTEALLYSAEHNEYHTAHGIPLKDMNRLTHQLRYQSERLNLDIHIETNKNTGTVSFICRKKPSWTPPTPTS